MLNNLKHWPTTLIGLLAFLATLPQLDWVQSLMSLNPKIATWVTGVAAIAAGLVLILGVGKANTQPKE